MGWHWGDGAEWWGMGLGMVAWIILLAAAIGLVVWLVNRGNGQRSVDRGGSAEEILRHRFASGEIDAEEYKSRLAVLRR
jgi:putative membrane protein